MRIVTPAQQSPAAPHCGPDSVPALQVSATLVLIVMAAMVPAMRSFEFIIIIIIFSFDREKNNKRTETREKKKNVIEVPNKPSKV